jgi:hypothetical protein
MPIIQQERAFDGFAARSDRLGLKTILDELRLILGDWQLLVMEERDANGGAALRKMIDERFAASEGWKKQVVGAPDWTKYREIDGVRLGLGVEIQVSARSDMVAVDLLHLKRALGGGVIDVGLLVVPSDRLGVFLTDRAPCWNDAIRILENFDAESLPIALWALEHDGPGPALPKQRRRA